jgi:hypothetical protein
MFRFQEAERKANSVNFPFLATKRRERRSEQQKYAIIASSFAPCDLITWHNAASVPQFPKTLKFAFENHQHREAARSTPCRILCIKILHGKCFHSPLLSTPVQRIALGDVVRLFGVKAGWEPLRSISEVEGETANFLTGNSKLSTKSSKAKRKNEEAKRKIQSPLVRGVDSSGSIFRL